MGKLLGQALKSARTQKNLRQQDVASALKVSRAAVGQWEAGETEPSTENLIQACQFLNINISAATSGMVKFVPMPNVGLDGKRILPDVEESQTINFVHDRRPEMRELEDEVGALIGTGVESRLMPRDVPVYGAVYGGDDGDFWMNGEIIDYVRRPPGIHRAKGVYALYVTGMSMFPRFEQGDVVFVDANRGPAIGDDAIVQLHGSDDGDNIKGLLKRLNKQTATVTTFEQFNPAGFVEIETRLIKAMHRVVPFKELLAV